MQAFFDKMVVNNRVCMIKAELPDLDKRLERTDKRVERMFRYDITNAVHKLNGCLIRVHQRELTGSPSEADLDMAAVAVYNSKDPYAGIRREETATQCMFYLVWTYVRHFPKFSPESSIQALKNMGYKVCGDPSLTATDDDDANGNRKRSATGAQMSELPAGTKAAKAAVRREAREAAEQARVSEAHISALSSLAKSSADRNSMMRDQNEVAFWSQPHVRATPEGETWLRLQLQRRLQSTSVATPVMATDATAASASTAGGQDGGSAEVNAARTDGPARVEPSGQEQGRNSGAVAPPAARTARLKAAMVACRRSEGYDAATDAVNHHRRSPAAATAAAATPGTVQAAAVSRQSRRAHDAAVAAAVADAVAATRSRVGDARFARPTRAPRNSSPDVSNVIGTEMFTVPINRKTPPAPAGRTKTPASAGRTTPPARAAGRCSSPASTASHPVTSAAASAAAARGLDDGDGADSDVVLVGTQRRTPDLQMHQAGPNNSAQGAARPTRGEASMRTKKVAFANSKQPVSSMLQQAIAALKRTEDTTRKPVAPEDPDLDLEDAAPPRGRSAAPASSASFVESTPSPPSRRRRRAMRSRHVTRRIIYASSSSSNDEEDEGESNSDDDAADE